MSDGLDCLRNITKATGGMFRVVPLMQQELKEIVEAAIAGDSMAILLAKPLFATHQQIEGAPSGQPMRCAACLEPLAGRSRGYAAVVSDPPLEGCAFALPVCEACGPEPAAIVEAVQPFLRLLWPEVRHLPAHAFAEGGTA